MTSSATDWISAVSGVFAALGTVGAVVVALFPDQVHDWLSPVGASIRLVSPSGELTTEYGGPVHYFHLQVENISRRRTLHSCRLSLVGLEGKEGDSWRVLPLPVPLLMFWAPQGVVPLEVDLSPNETQPADLVVLRKITQHGTPVLEPVLAVYPNNFRGRLGSAGSIRYVIELKARELRMPRRATIEVQWDGAFPHATEAVPASVSIRRLASATA